jgi:hypothetical protein
VAIFITEKEDSGVIAEALNWIKSTLNIQTSAFVIDHSLAELNGIRSAFPGILVHTIVFTIIIIGAILVSIFIYMPLSDWLESLCLQCFYFLPILDSPILFCDFHRQQAWNRWLRRYGPPEARESLRALMEEVAEAANEEALSAAVNNLRLSPLYDAEVRQYFEAHWLDSKQVRSIYFISQRII